MVGPWLWKETESKVMAENHEIRLIRPFVCRHCPSPKSQGLEVNSTGQADGMICYGSHGTDGIMVQAISMGGICMMSGIMFLLLQHEEAWREHDGNVVVMSSLLTSKGFL